MESDLQRLLGVERYILGTICFNFTSKMPFPYVIKLGRHFKSEQIWYLGGRNILNFTPASKHLTKFAWRLTVDSHRTLVPLQYPPHVVALGCLYLAALLTSFEQTPEPEQPDHISPQQFTELLGRGGEWENKFQARIGDLEGTFPSLVLDLGFQPIA